MRTRSLILRLLIAAIVAAAVAPALMAAGPSAKDLFNKGRKAEKAGRMTEAFLLYSQAAAMSPQNGPYWVRAQAVRASAEMESQQASPAAVAAADPPAFEAPTAQDRAEALMPLPAAELRADPGTKDFDLRGDSRKLFEDMAKAWGLECVFDPDYQPVNSFRFELTGADYRQALHAMELATGSFIVPLSGKRFLVAKDTVAKRAELEPVVEVAVELPAANPQDLQAMIAAVQQSMNIEKFSFDTQKNLVFLKDRISKVIPARDMFQNFMHPQGEVLFELQFLEVSRNDAITYGIDFQTQFPLAALTNWFNNKASIPSAVSGLLLFGGGKTLMGLGVINPTLVAKMSESSGRVLLQSVMRSLDGQPATMHVGDRYPVLTSGYFGPANFGGPNAYAPPPSFNYEDLGLNLKVTPTLHDDEEVTLDVESEFKVLSGASYDGIPVISNRQIKSKVRLRLGQWAAIAGLLNSQEARSVAGLAGLAKIPVLGPLFSTRDKTTSNQQVLVLLRPRLLRLPASALPSYSFLLGSDTKPITPL